ncbi:MAG: hypothetical protein ACD_74C00210G0001 [uncultured bacterium]|nr:MAG: hypothetical protein ACD_74C00210G0001 [uncultured bacterium]
MNAHAPLDPAVDGVSFVHGKIVAGFGPQENDDLFQGALLLRLQRETLGLGHDQGMREIVDNLAGQRLRRGDQIDEPGINGVFGHAVELGRGRFLRQRHSRFFLDGPQA